jgi:hypothetical protein
VTGPGTSLRERRNLVPSAYRGVSVGETDVPLDEDHLRAHLLGREAYRRTRFLVLRDGHGAAAVVHVEKESQTPLFSPIVAVQLLAGPADCVYVVAPDADTAVPSAMAKVAVERAPGARAVVVEGRYEHVSFIVNPAPLRVVVHEVVPPYPPKLLDQVERLLAVAEDLPPMLPVADVVTLAELARERPSPRYLLPCSGSGVAIAAAETAYLDQRPAREDWTLLGCARSREIHAWFYGDESPYVDTCPRERAADGTVAVLSKCCLLEDENAHDGSRVVVPWGATLQQVRGALEELARRWEPAWQPA